MNESSRMKDNYDVSWEEKGEHVIDRKVLKQIVFLGTSIKLLTGFLNQ